MMTMTTNEKDADDSDMDDGIILIFHRTNLFLVDFVFIMVNFKPWNL